MARRPPPFRRHLADHRVAPGPGRRSSQARPAVAGSNRLAPQRHRRLAGTMYGSCGMTSRFTATRAPRNAPAIAHHSEITRRLVESLWARAHGAQDFVLAAR